MNATSAPVLVWFRRDLRLADQPALRAAVTSRSPVIPVFLWSPEDDGDWGPGGASRWWLHHSLASLQNDLTQLKSHLIVRQGSTVATLLQLVKETHATAVYWNRLYEPAARQLEEQVADRLAHLGVASHASNAALLYEPWEVQTGGKTPFKVFTPFWRACLARGAPEEPHRVPRSIVSPSHWPRSDALAPLGLLPKIHWETGLQETWQPGEAGVAKRLRAFVKGAVDDYDSDRDRPDRAGTSQLSPHLHWGELSPRQIWHAVRRAVHRRHGRGGKGDDIAKPYLRQLVWREFAHHLLYHFPHTPTEPLREEFAHFPWKRSPKALRAWQSGQTGYPIVDAGMRALWHTGWMHNRVRLIVASFLIKDLLLPWQKGAEWFWETLVDADLANNTLGWQWTAGCGADAAPYFRIFNPVTQGKKFDPDGAYVRQWVPELANLSAEYLHEPWSAPEDVLQAAGIKLGKDYPTRLVDHAEARQAALEALKEMNRRRG